MDGQDGVLAICTVLEELESKSSGFKKNVDVVGTLIIFVSYSFTDQIVQNVSERPCKSLDLLF